MEKIQKRTIQKIIRMINGKKIKSDKKGIGLKVWVPEKKKYLYFLLLIINC